VIGTATLAPPRPAAGPLRLPLGLDGRRLVDLLPLAAVLAVPVAGAAGAVALVATTGAFLLTGFAGARILAGRADIPALAALAVALAAGFALAGPAPMAALAVVAVVEILRHDVRRLPEAVSVLLLLAGLALRVDAGTVALGAARDGVFVLFVAAAAGFVVLADGRGEPVPGRPADRFARVVRDAAALAAGAGAIGAFLLWTTPAGGGMPGPWALAGVVLLAGGGAWWRRWSGRGGKGVPWPALPWLGVFVPVTLRALADGSAGLPLP